MAGWGGTRGRWAGTVAAGVMFGGAALPPRAAVGQAYGPARAAASRASRPRAVALRLRPRAGDTVRTRFEQTVRFTPRDAAPGAGGAAAPAPTTAPASAMLVIARSIVERADATGALLLAITDSVAFSAAGAPPAVVERMRRAMQGRRAQLRVAPDGALAADGPLGIASALRLPGTLPAAVVAPGATWRRAMAVPSWGPAATPPHLDVSFRFDSMTADGARAFISLRGRVHDGAGGEEDDAAPAAPGTESGHVDGGLVVDLARGWVVESWATFRLDGVMVSGQGGAATPVRVVVTQRLRAY